MYKNVLESIQGVEIFPIISLAIFVLFFAAMLYKIIRMDKAMIKKMEALPLDSNNFVGENENEK